jgi:hypothetical protein
MDEGKTSLCLVSCGDKSCHCNFSFIKTYSKKNLDLNKIHHMTL